MLITIGVRGLNKRVKSDYGQGAMSPIATI